MACSKLLEEQVLGDGSDLLNFVIQLKVAYTVSRN